MMTTKTPAPYLLGLLLGCFLLFLVWSGFRASTRGSEITDPDYYSKGLKYNTTLVEKRAASALGWQLQVALSDRSLNIVLQDNREQPVAGGDATLYLFQPSAAVPRALLLTETAPGVYRLALPDDLRGEHRARLDFHKDGARLNRQLLLNL